MAIRTLPRDEWATYFDAFSRSQRDADRVDVAEIRVLSPEDGAQPATDWLPLRGLTYDSRGDLLEVLVDGLDHLIGHPQTIYVDETSGRLDRFEVVRTDDIREIVEIR